MAPLDIAPPPGPPRAPSPNNRHHRIGKAHCQTSRAADRNQGAPTQTQDRRPPTGYPRPGREITPGDGMNDRPPAGRRGRLETVPGPERRELCRTSDAPNGRRPGPWPRAETGPRSARSGPGRPPPAASCSAPGPPRQPTPRGGPGCGHRSPKWS